MNVIKSDILIIGGGIAGCFAALKGCEKGKSVVILDKATLRRGGSVGPGMDHISVGVHPETMSLAEAKQSAVKKRKELFDPNVMLALDVFAYERAMDLQSYGVPVKEDDGSLFIWKIPERHFHLVSYRGKDTKVKLAEAVKRTPARIFERTMGVELLKHNGSIVGAAALNTRSGEFSVFLAPATILSTGESGRQYIEPDGPYMTYFPNTNSGDSEAMAYRAGAEMTNMEYIYLDYTSVRCGGGIAGIKPFEKMGKLVNRFGESILNSKEDSANRAFLMMREIAEGRGPIYWDFRHLPADVIKCYEREMSHEYPITKEWFKQRNLDLSRDLIPIQLVPACIQGGPLVDESFKTSLPGLYAAGATNAFVMGLTEAGVSGYIAGEHAASYACADHLPQLSAAYLADIEKNVFAPLSRGEGINPQELEIAIRSVVTDYVGYFKSEGMMMKGLDKLLEFREHFAEKMTARNIHELMRCLEVNNIFDMIEMHIRASLYRKETRLRRVGLFPHFRADYPKTDPAWEKFVVIRKDENNINITTAEIPELKEA
jgi:succinate dehydrogenase/fumarate reductase flavoprotein subunit